MAHDKLPVDDVIEEGYDIPHNPASVIYSMLKQGWEPIEWQEIEAEGEMFDAVVDAASQFYYLYLSHVLLLGGVIEREDDSDAKRLAVLLAGSRMRDVDAWGRFLGQAQATAQVPSALKEYLHALHDDENIESRLIGIGLADVYRRAIGDTLKDFDPLFQRLIERDAEQAEKNREALNEYLTDVVPELKENRQDVLDQLWTYRELTKQVVLAHADAFEEVGEEASDIVLAVENQADQFYREVGLSNEI